MYSLIRHVPTRVVVQTEVPALGLSLLAVEVFYKFHSFTLECLCFLATWAALSSAFSLIMRLSDEPKDTTPGRAAD